MSIKDQHIEYFKALVEGRDDVEDWSLWWSKHEQELQQWLSPGQIARLKRGPLYTLYGILDELGYHYQRPEHYVHAKFHEPLLVPMGWLIEKVSLSAVDQELQRNSSLEAEWRLVKARMKDGDECWSFRSPPETWQHMSGRAGYAIVREGRPVDGVVMLLN